MTKDEISAYDTSPRNQEYFTPTTFRIDFSKPWTKFAFNIEARDYFLQHLLHTLRGGKYKKEEHWFPERYWTAYHLGAAFDTYIDTCRVKIRKIVDPHDSDDPDRDAQKARARSRRNTVRVFDAPYCAIILICVL